MDFMYEMLARFPCQIYNESCQVNICIKYRKAGINLIFSFVEVVEVVDVDINNSCISTNIKNYNGDIVE